MQLKINSSILSRISQLIKQNPLWGLLLANEYLLPNSGLHRALQFKARQALATIKYSTQALSYADQIFSGTKLSQLPEVNIKIFSQPASFKKKHTFQFEPTQIASRSTTRQNSAFGKLGNS